MPINGRYYDWEHITLKLRGQTLVDVQSLEYSDEQKVNRKYGKGRRTRGYTLGNYEGSGKLTLLREEYDRLMGDAEVQQKGIYGLDPFQVVANYDKGNGELGSEVLEDCVFQKRSFGGIEQDTEGPTVELEFVVLGDIRSNDTPPLPEE